MKVGIVSPYFDTMGGGERYVLTVAECFLKWGDRVTLFWRKGEMVDRIVDRFGLDLAGVKICNNVFANGSAFWKRVSLTAHYQLMFFLSDGSVPFSLAPKNILHFQVPLLLPNQDNLKNRFKLTRFGHVVCNSYFTKKFIDKTFGIKSEVLYPPVDIENFRPAQKTNIILAVGRFFSPSHPKKQIVMLKSFIDLCRAGLSGWELVLVGGVTGEASYLEVEKLKKMSQGFPVKIYTDTSLVSLQNCYAQAKLFWHATGYGENLDEHPDRAEHFGIATVEAMSAGCVPLVFSGGGQKEIINRGINGYLWSSTEELMKDTLKVIADDKLREKLAKNAQKRAADFSKAKFRDQLRKMI